MALIHCPECGKEISDDVKACPQCGYRLKKKNTAKVVIIVMVVLALIASGVLSYVYYFKPNSIMNHASNLMERGRYDEADILLASVPANSRKQELMTQICLAEAHEALANGNYALAEEKLSQISEESISSDLLTEISMQKAAALLGQGCYVEADELFAALEQTEEIQTLRKKLFYESRVLHCALMEKDGLIYPESMVLLEAVCVEGGKTKSDDLSTDETEVYDYNQPTIILHFQAQSKGGSMTESFVRYSWQEGKYVGHRHVSTLTADRTLSKIPSGLSGIDYIYEQEEIVEINKEILKHWEMGLDDEQLAEVNNALQGTTSKSSEMIANNEIVPLPTREVVAVTPEPEN